jgi:tripartite-type tricarboxylate transporter receptor subunit TctC
MGLDPIGSTPAEFAAFIEKDAQQAAEVVKAQGIVAD